MANKIADSSAHFVSLMGKTVMGTLQPLSAYAQHISRPLSIHLLHTRGVEAQAQFLADWLEKNEYPGLEIAAWPIAANMAADDYGPPVTDVYRKLEADLGHLAINALGGQKHHSLPALTALARLQDHIFLQTMDDGFYVTWLDGQNIRTKSYKLPSARPIKELLALQNLEYQPQPDAPNNLKNLGRKLHLTLPKNRLNNIIIGGLRWDCLWNPGNNVIHGLMLAQPSPDSTPAEHARAIIDLTLNKKNLADLYTREFFVVESSVNAHIRLQYEAGLKVTSKHSNWPDHLTNPQFTATEEAGQDLLEFLTGVFKSGTKTKPEPRKLDKVSVSTEVIPTLVTAMSSGDATLLALSSHQCRQAIILFTPDDNIIAARAHKIKDRASDFGLEQIFLLPAAIEGHLRTAIPNNLGPVAQVNVTPGSKGLGLALTLWGLVNGAQLWSINKDGGGLVRFDAQEESRGLKPIALKTRLDIVSEATISNYGWNHEAEDWNHPFYDQMLKFMRKIQGANLEPDFLRQSVSLDGYNLQRTSNQGWKLTWPGGEGQNKGSYQFTWQETGLEGKKHPDGHWYEKLTAKAIDALNGQPNNLIHKFEVAAGVEVAKTDQTINFSYKSPDHTLTERDVLVADNGGNLYLISCKAYPPEPELMDKFITELRATASPLGRFTIPLLCTLSTGHYSVHNGVVIFGWDYLCRPKKLRQILNLAAQEARQA
ncbi:MAG: hypothetical protein LBP55_08050 [Candidatus Adiutrix sp.]|jgi:hypothetical protein|nr:hypothetical protein [Candidatus Adiutrix sp.]